VTSVVVVAGAIGYLLYASTQEGAEHYRHVDEVMAAPESYRGKRLKVHGHVVDGSIELAKGTMQYRFKIESKAPRTPAVVEARYTGLVPDTFKSGAETVLTGRLTADNRVEVARDGIMAKCPSKYEAEQIKPGAGSGYSEATRPPAPLGTGVAQTAPGP